jgi:hypothetical protein
MKDADCRLERLQRGCIMQLAAAAGVSYGLTAEDLLDETQQFFALSEAEQRRQLAELATEYPNIFPREWVSHNATFDPR